MNRFPLLTAHTDGPGGVLLAVVAMRGSGSGAGKAVSDTDIMSTVMAIVHGRAVDTEHWWSSAEFFNGGQILMNESVDLFAFTLMDQPEAPHHHITIPTVSSRDHRLGIVYMSF